MRELLDDIVRRQLVADVPRCVLLSGGLDSSALTALAARQLGEQGETVRSFSVDFVGQAENFTADEFRPTPDTPFVHDVAEHVHSDHTDVVLNSDELTDPALRRLVVTANDAPNGRGDMDASLYLLFKAIRAKSTVALSGESADEVFGGYRWFHTKEAQKANTFPWLTQFVAHRGDPGRAGATVQLGSGQEARPARLSGRPVRDRGRRGDAAGRRGRVREPHAGDELPAPDPVRAHPAGPQGSDEHGRRP